MHVFYVLRLYGVQCNSCVSYRVAFTICYEMGSEVKSNGYSVVSRSLSHCTEKGREAEEVRRKMIDDLTNELRPTQENLSYYKRKMIDSINKFERIRNKIERWQEDCKHHSILEHIFHSQIEELANLKESQRTTRTLLIRVQAESAEIRTKNYALIEKLKCEKNLNYCLHESANEEGAISSDKVVFISQLKPVPVKPHDGKTQPGIKGKQAPKIMKTKTNDAMKQKREETNTISSESLKHLRSLYKETCKRYEDYIRILMEFCEEAEFEKITQQKDMEKLKTILETRAHDVEHQIFCVNKELQKVNEEFYHSEVIWHTHRARLIDSVNKLHAYVTDGKALSDDCTIYGGGSSTQRTLSEDMAEEYRELEKKVKAYKDKYGNLMEENAWSKSDTEKRQILLEKKLKELRSEITVQMKNYKELDRRQRLEVEGFLNEIKILQNLLKNVERKIAKECGKDFFVTISEVAKEADTTEHNVKKIIRGINDLLYSISVM